MDRLKDSPLFHGLTDDQMDQVLALGSLVTYQAGETMLKLGTAASDLYIILEGKATAVTWDSDKLMDLGHGSVFGALSFVDGQPQPAHILAATNCTVAKFPAADLRQLMNRDRDLGFVLLATMSRVIAHRYRKAISQLDDLFDEVGDVWENAL
jgi:CRP-like cAMP-binding protein